MAPPPAFPPTPAASGDIKGRDNDNFMHFETNFELPPSAVGANHHAAHHSARSPPLSPAESRKEVESLAENNALPPPPTRSRKIIHMKPKPTNPKDSEHEDATYAPPASKNAKTNAKDSGKRKAAGGGASGNAATRKVARKTAHSIIERRRRSKMNEEFGVLKDLIPACRGVEMHKLAILQASIEYLRYLESCVTDLKAGRAQSSEAPSIPSRDSMAADDEDDDDDDNANNDYDDADGGQQDSMEIDEPARPSVSLRPPQHLSSSSLAATARAALSPASPYAVAEYNAAIHRNSISSITASTALPSPYFGPLSSRESNASANLSHSQTTSPIFGPYKGSGRGSHHKLPSIGSATGFYAHSRDPSTHTSPVIVPQNQGLNEAEASTALLMLNKDRRHSRGSGSGSAGVASSGSASSGSSAPGPERRGMSVRDLLRGQE